MADRVVGQKSSPKVAFAASGPITLDTPVYSRSTATGRIEFTMDSGADIGIGIVAGSIKSTSGGNSPHAGTTEDLDRWDGAANLSVGHETAQGTGSRLIGFSLTWLCGAAGVMLIEQEIDITPTPWGMGLGFHAGAAAVGADRIVPGARMAPLSLGFRAGQVSAQAPRQIMLTGNDLETPQMTDGGTEGQVLTQHAATKPTWEDAGGGGGGSVATDAIWDAKGDLAGGTGADTASALTVGADDEVLTADAAEATGMKWAAPAAAPSEGTSFPGSPTTDLRYYRTDHDMWFRFDGTRWLSETLYRATLQSKSIPPFRVTVNPHRNGFASGFDLWLEEWHSVIRQVAGGSGPSGSHYWTVSMLIQPTGTTIATWNNSTHSLSTFTEHKETLDVVLDTDTDIIVQDKVEIGAGTPGDLDTVTGELWYRVIAT